MKPTGAAAGNAVGAGYRERLWAPIGWWLFGGFFTASIWVAYEHAAGPRVALPVTTLLAIAVAAGIIAYGRVPVSVDAEGFTAGRARLPYWAIGRVEPLDEAATRAARGGDLDARAYPVIRGYIPTAVRVAVRDDADPVPYWLVSTRHPQRLAAALEAARDSGRNRAESAAESAPESAAESGAGSTDRGQQQPKP